MCVVVRCCSSIDRCDIKGQLVSFVVTECMLLSDVVQVLIDVTLKDSL